MKKVFSLDKGWKLKKEIDILKSGLDDYFNMFDSDAKTGMSSDARGNSYYDGDWDGVNLPDDWNTREKCSKDFEDNTHGHKPRGVVWYRKTFSMDKEFEDKRIFLKFEAIAIKSDIWLNSIKIVHSESGYTPIYVEVTDFIRTDRQNCLAVRCDNTVKEGWWYEGGGIYGNTWLIVADRALLTENGTFIHSEKISDDTWNVKLDIEIDTPETTVMDEAYQLFIVSKELGVRESIAAAKSKNTLDLAIYNPILWDIENPKLYEFEIKLMFYGEIVDTIRIQHGFRTIQFDSKKGFFLNEKSVKLKGVCIHHDFAGVGIAVPYEIQRYRIQKLKEMGCNAIRTSHNPQLENFYRACDEMGILVMDEVRHFSSTTECLEQLKTFIRRDRNHPCVIMWSIFNEEPLQCTTIGKKIARTMKKLVYELDGTRPVTGGMNGPMEIEGVVKEIDIVGFNYGQYEYDEFHEIYPDIPIIGSETASYLTTRDTVETKAPYLSSFGNVLFENLHKWSANIGDTWKYIDERDFVAGGFDWTGFDYRGECGGYPEAVCNFGAMDLCGFPKGAFYWHKVIWEDTPQIYLSPYWNYTPDAQVQVVCYSNCDEIEVFLNDEKIYSGKHDKYRMSIIDTVYKPGTLKAVGYRNGEVVAEHILSSPSGERRLILQPARSVITNRHDDWDVVDVFLTDEKGTVIADASEEVRFDVEGGSVIGVGNGDICFHEEEKRNFINLFHGCAQLIVAGEKDLEITARCDELIGFCNIKVNESDSVEYVLNENIQIEIASWRQSDVQGHYIEEQFIADLMFAWIPTTVGYGKNLLYSGKQGFSEVCGQVMLTPNMREKKFAVVFEKIQGNVDIYLDHDFAGGFIDGEHIVIPIDMQKYEDSLVVSVVFKLEGSDCGIVGNVYIAEIDA